MYIFCCLQVNGPITGGGGGELISGKGFYPWGILTGCIFFVVYRLINWRRARGVLMRGNSVFQ